MGCGPQATTESIIGLLRKRFGNELQAERFKAELRARRHKPGEPPHQLYLDICRLVALAYPSSEPALVNHVAKEAFITALGDAKLQLKLMEREPKTVGDALNLATKLEAYEKSLSVPGRPEETEDSKNRGRTKKVCIVEEDKEAEVTSSLQRQVAELQDALAQATGRLKELEADTERDRAATSAAVPVSGSCPVAVRAQPVPTVDQASVGQRPSHHHHHFIILFNIKLTNATMCTIVKQMEQSIYKMQSI